jgi:hypothetical protein
VWYEAYGDCCSHTWINDILDVSVLLGQRVTGVETLELEQDDYDGDDERDEYIAHYGFAIKTGMGCATIEFRNASNGYYGGSLEHYDTRRNEPDVNLIAVTKDYTANQ